MEELPKDIARHTSQPYTQKLIDAGILEFYTTADVDINTENEMYCIKEGYFLTLDKEGYDYPEPISDFIERYKNDKFEAFEVCLHNENIEDLENVENIADNITCYKKLPI